MDVRLVDWWSDADRGKSQYSEKAFYQSHRKSYMDWTVFEPAPSWLGAGN